MVLGIAKGRREHVYAVELRKRPQDLRRRVVGIDPMDLRRVNLIRRRRARNGELVPDGREVADLEDHVARELALNVEVIGEQVGHWAPFRLEELRREGRRISDRNRPEAWYEARLGRQRDRRQPVFEQEGRVGRTQRAEAALD